MKQYHVTNKYSPIEYKLGLFGPRLTYHSNPALFDITISLFIVTIYIRFVSPQIAVNGNYGFYCLSRPDMFVIEWGNRFFKRFEMPWVKILIKRQLKTIYNDYVTLSQNDVISLHECVKNHKELYVKTNEIWGYEFEYFVVKNTYALNLFKNNKSHNITKYEVYVDIITPIIDKSRLIFEVDSDEEIIEKIGVEILSIFINDQIDDRTK